MWDWVLLGFIMGLFTTISAIRIIITRTNWLNQVILRAVDAYVEHLTQRLQKDPAFVKNIVEPFMGAVFASLKGPKERSPLSFLPAKWRPLAEMFLPTILGQLKQGGKEAVKGIVEELAVA